MKIDFYPIMRDCIFYGISVLALMFVLHDELVKWYEAIVLLLLYCVYIVIMYYNAEIEKIVKRKQRKIEHDDTLKQVNKRNTRELVYTIELRDQNEFLEPEYDAAKINNNKDDEEETPYSPFKIPRENFFKALIWFILFPISLLFYFTIPDPNKKFFQKFPFYFITFLFSTAYVAILTYFLVWMTVILSSNLGIPDTVAGLTLLAAGTSLPEVVSSIIITRNGKGGMAISNSIGSNVFDILMCLGLPWFIENVIIKPFYPIQVFSKGIFYSAGILFSSICVLLVCLIFNKWELDRRFGFIMMGLWVAVIVLTCLFEYDVFGKFSMPNC